METPDEFAWTLYEDFWDDYWRDKGATSRRIAARDEAIRADERAKVLAEFTEWFAPGFTFPNGRTAPIGRETVAREFAAAEARDTASPEDDTPTLVVRRLVGPWEPIEDEGGAS